MKPSFVELAYSHTAIGLLSLRKRTDLLLGGIEVYDVKLGDEFLMSSLFHAAEDALANLAIERARGDDLEVVVGGLGLGHTAATALEHQRITSILIVDFLAEVIDWHRTGLVPLGHTISNDKRTEFIQGDFFQMSASKTGFDLKNPGRKFHCILLDVDHTPRHTLDSKNSEFYTREGLTSLSHHLREGGVFALWSNDPPDEEFIVILNTVFSKVEAKEIEFENPYQKRMAAATIYIANL